MWGKPKTQPEPNNRDEIFTEKPKPRGTISPWETQVYPQSDVQELVDISLLLFDMLLERKESSLSAVEQFTQKVFHTYTSLSPAQKINYLLSIEAYFVSIFGYQWVKLSMRLRECINLKFNTTVKKMFENELLLEIQGYKKTKKPTPTNLGVSFLQWRWYRERQQKTKVVERIFTGKELPYEYVHITDENAAKSYFASFLFTLIGDSFFEKQVKSFALGDTKIFLWMSEKWPLFVQMHDFDADTRERLYKALWIRVIPT